MSKTRMSERRLGVYVCHCGGNISDYVNVEEVRKAASLERDVIVAKTTMFACSDAAQKEMERDIKELGLDGLVVASCSPRLHTITFRGVARRAGLNPYQYVQVNIREGCSWAHRKDEEGATEKAVALVKAGIASAALSLPLEPIRVETVPAVLIIGCGVSGLSAALALSDLGIETHLVEKSPNPGGMLASRRSIYPGPRDGRTLVKTLVEEAEGRENIHFHFESRVLGKTGSVGDFNVEVQGANNEPEMLRVGSIIVATGAESYEPAQGEYGYGLPGVMTLSQFMDVCDQAEPGELLVNGKPVTTICYIYCVGSRQNADEENAHTYCSRYCCGSAMHAAVSASKIDENLRQYHLYRDIRTYGKLEPLYEEANRLGSYIIKFDPGDPPLVEGTTEPGKTGEESITRGGEPSAGGIIVKVKDKLHGDDEFTIDADLVVLVTGMVPRKDDEIKDVLKIPLDANGFFNEIHPKLRPVETVMDGIMISGCCQAPRNTTESVASSFAAAAATGSILMKGYVELEPLVAKIDSSLCEWCGKCAESCPYLAIGKVMEESAEGVGKAVAAVNKSVCKGCGGCVPVCPRAAVELNGFEHERVMRAIEALAHAPSIEVEKADEQTEIRAQDQKGSVT